MRDIIRERCWGPVIALILINGCHKSPEPQTITAPVKQTIKIEPPIEAIQTPPPPDNKAAFRDYTRRLATNAALFLQNKIWMDQNITFQLECDPNFTAVQDGDSGEVILAISGTVKSTNGTPAAIPIKKRDKHLKCFYKEGEWSCETSFSELVEIGRMGNYGK